MQPDVVDASSHGVLSLVPAAVVFLLALISKRTFEALVGGTLVGFALVSGTGFFAGFAESLLKVMADPTIGWIILVVGMFGALIALLVRSGATISFGDLVATRIKGRRSALLATWAMGLLIFLDDYLNALAVGSSMQRVTDGFRIAREKLAYVVDSTAAPVCVLIPLSTWAIYVSGLLEANGLAETGEGLSLYVQVIPYMIYPWAAVVLVPLVALGLVPDLGPMRRAEERARTGKLAPPDSPSLEGRFTREGTKPAPVGYFVFPLAVLIGTTWYFDIDALRGVLAAVVVAVLLFWGSGRLRFGEVSESFFEGFQSMVYPLAIVVMSFSLRDVNDALGLTPFVIETVEPVMTGALLPVVSFATLSLITFATGSFWGVYAVSLPIIVPLAQAVDVSVPLTLGAVVSAGAFGSHACFYGDATVLAASSSGCNLLAHVWTQLPYVILSALVASIGFLVLGFTL